MLEYIDSTSIVANIVCSGIWPRAKNVHGILDNIGCASNTVEDIVSSVLIILGVQHTFQAASGLLGWYVYLGDLYLQGSYQSSYRVKGGRGTSQ